MGKKNAALPTVDEVISLLKKTRLPTVIIEGTDDLIVYKRLEHHFYESDLSVLPVGGRNNVLKIYDRANELPQDSKVLFIADKDIWAITGIPANYQSEKIFFTNGYSIENDAFQDCQIPHYMNTEERSQFESELERYLQWYSLAVERKILNGDESIKNHPNHILDAPDEFQKLTKLNEGETFPEQRHKAVKDDYQNLIRGKSLIQLAMRQLSYKGRAVRHSDSSFLEHAAVNPGPLIRTIFTNIELAIQR